MTAPPLLLKPLQPLQVLSAGAAKGLFAALAQRIASDCGARVEGRFGAVGAVREWLLAGAACDLMVSTQAMLQTLADGGQVRADRCAPLGRVKTGVAVLAAQPLPDLATPEALKAALLAAEAIYFPDPERATAGIHFVQVLRRLGIHDTLAPRFRSHPNGAAAMQAMAAAGAPGAIGCTQVSEILYSPGVALAGALPAAFELATLYSAAVGRDASDPALAAQVVALLCGPASAGLRADAGFEALD